MFMFCEKNEMKCYREPITVFTEQYDRLFYKIFFIVCSLKCLKQVYFS